jgi:AraC family transcriptional regulator of adaptative response/methylated-DNA-[protein]-cysteine methyltransferase
MDQSFATPGSEHANDVASAAGPLDDESAWKAVLARDERSDGRFVYAVTSTGVYCRPSCPSRRPRPDGVRFFATAEKAERAGFRPCRRCRPREAPAAVLLVRRACEILDSRFAEGPFGPTRLEALARAVGASPFHLQRTFKRVTGISPREYAAGRRAARFRARLAAGDPIASATYEAGFGSPSRAYERASDELGMTPASYRRGGPGVAIRYATARCSLGRLLVAATARGVAAVALGDDDATLVAGLVREYPRAEVARAPDGDLARWLEALLAHLDGVRPLESLPLDVRATAFQRRVWSELRRIPSGEVRSYGEVAAAIGRPEAARAVAGACAGNPVALAVPCHRVVRSDGGLGGYRWGSERKRALLELERQQGGRL